MTRQNLDRERQLKPTELVVIGYLIVTGILILFNFQHIRILNPLLFRATTILLIFMLSKLRQSELLQFVRLILPFLLLGYLYDETDNLNNFIFQDQDKLMSGIEASIFSSQPALLFAVKFHGRVISELMYFGYFSYYLIVIFLPVLFYLKENRYKGEKLAFLIINSFMIYYLIFIFFPVAGPQFYFNNENLPTISGGFFSRIVKLIQFYGEKPTGAFPSSHVGIAFIVLWFCIVNKPKWSVIIILPVYLLVLSTVYIRAHYVIDVIAAVIITPLIYWFSNKLYMQFNKKPLNYISSWT